MRRMNGQVNEKDYSVSKMMKNDMCEGGGDGGRQNDNGNAHRNCKACV